MLDLDERFDAAHDELRARLDTIPLGRPAVVRRRHRTRAVTMALSAVLLVGTAVAVGILARGDGPPLAPLSPAESAADQLPYPSQVIGGTPDSITAGPSLGTSATGLVAAPDGTLFQVAVNERGGYQGTPGLVTRAVGGTTYTVEDAEHTIAYVALSDCSQVFVGDYGVRSAPWDENALALLSGLRVDGRNGVLTLPTGWTSFGSGVAGTPIQMGYAVEIDGEAHAISLMMIPNSPVSTLLFLLGRPATTTFAGGPAWSGNGGVGTALAWQDGTTAVSVRSTDLTVDQLRTVAAELEYGHGTELAPYVEVDPADITPVGTQPPSATVVLPDCGTPRLTIEP